MAYTTLADGLQQLGFFKGGVAIESIIESGAIRLFMPHGVGHGLGLDVHDCEAFGERTFDIANFSEESKHVESCIIRSQWRLREGTILTNEPGLYFIPALIQKYKSEGKHNNIINFDMVDRYLNFGGIRIEDNLEITATGAREIGSDSGRRIPRTVEELEEVLRR